MSNLLDHPAHKSTDKRGIFKGLVVGDSGSGKTGALASLVDAGYKLRILDFDAGLDPLVGYVKKKEHLANVDYETLRDEFKMMGSYLAVSKAPAYQRGMKLLQDWNGSGPVQQWDADTILVIDTLGRMARASFNMVLQANAIVQPSGNRGGPEQSHYGTAMENVERTISLLMNPEVVPCHVLVNAHWAYQEDGSGIMRPFPETIGSKLNPKVARDFNNLFSVSISAGKRSIKVKKDGIIACKASRKLSKEQYDIETGLAEIFLEVVGKHPAQ
jgi:AAA domain